VSHRTDLNGKDKKALKVLHKKVETMQLGLKWRSCNIWRKDQTISRATIRILRHLTAFNGFLSL